MKQLRTRLPLLASSNLPVPSKTPRREISSTSPFPADHLELARHLELPHQIVAMPSRHEEERSEEGSVGDGLPDLGDSIDALTFEQILEMDDDEDEREFSKSIVFGFFDQAEETFVKMDKALEDGDLPELSSLGHFLKGSSATLGLTKVKESCEKIQHYGQQKDEAGTTDEPDEKLCLSRIKEILVTVKEEYAEVEKVLKKFYATPAAS